MKVLIIGHTIPEPTTTAAGVRMLQLIEQLQEANCEIVFASTAKTSEKSFKLHTLGIDLNEIVLNDPSFDQFVSEVKPQVVLFDRYITEEQFGWRVQEACPHALRILDTEDLHFLRKARETAVKSGKIASEAEVHSELAKRELASMLRCDLSLIISEYEMKLLIETFKIPHSLLLYLPLFGRSPSEVHIEALPNFSARKHFVTIGNFQHAPNADAVKWLKEAIWPAIRAQLPEIELHIYGAYASEQLKQWNDAPSGFMVKGWVENVDALMESARVCLAPLRFGAGIKGKIIDAMRNGTPVITTAIGAEGISGAADFPGFIADNEDQFVAASISMYTDKSTWTEAKIKGFDLLAKKFEPQLFSGVLVEKIRNLKKHLEEHRKEHFIGQILHYKTLNTTKYLSRWIEAKGKNHN